MCIVSGTRWVIYHVGVSVANCVCPDQPTYYHFHIHVVNVMLEAGATQATGKAFGLENLISQIETLQGDNDASMADVSLTYYLGEASESWTDIFAPLKQGLQPKGQ